MALYGEKEWYFFSPRDRKYPNGSRPNRAAGTGYWKATGADKPVGRPKPLAIKKALVFYAGKAPKGVKTNWIMHEYRLANVDRSAGKNKNLRVGHWNPSFPFKHLIEMGKSKSRELMQFLEYDVLQLDDWVLCRIYNKKGRIEKYSDVDEKPGTGKSAEMMQEIEVKPDISMLGQSTRNEQLHYMDSSDSFPRLHTDSSCSEHVLSPEFTCEKEVQSEPKWNDLDKAFDFQFDSLDRFLEDIQFEPQVYQFPAEQYPIQDTFAYLQKPF